MLQKVNFNQNYKRCSECLEEKELISNHWYKDSNKSDYFRSECKTCSNKRKKQYYKDNIDWYTKYHSKPEVKFKAYKNRAKYKNIKFNLTYEQFTGYWKKPCGYCGDKIKTIGLDRVNNKKGYITSNIISCCSVCNMMKRTLKVNDWIDHMTKVIEHTRDNDSNQ